MKQKDLTKASRELATLNASTSSLSQPSFSQSESSHFENDHLRKKLADQAQKLEVLTCEKSALTMELQTVSRRLDVEIIGGSPSEEFDSFTLPSGYHHVGAAEFREFAPRKVPPGVIKLDKLCQRGVLTLQKMPNMRISLAAYIGAMLLLNLFWFGRILMG